MCLLITPEQMGKVGLQKAERKRESVMNENLGFE
jgi:hypothetical protein